MSVWAAVTGTVTLSISAHVSLKKFLKDRFDEVCIDAVEWTTHDGERRYHRVRFSFCSDGMDAAKQVDALVSDIRNLGGKAELQATITFS